MSEEKEVKQSTQDEIIGESVIKLELTVNSVNALLNVLGQAPFIASSNLIHTIQSQGVPQLQEIQKAMEAVAAAEKKDA
jgi:hypothetical protein